jgi:parallel beta-helix repeat protein
MKATTRITFGILFSTMFCLTSFGTEPPKKTHVPSMNPKDEMKQFQTLKSAKWEEVLNDPCTQNWKDHWALDGKKATITHTPKGMDFSAGPVAFNDAHHAVLWTKQSFKGDVKIEYEYTRSDKELRMVNIIYIQATGSGKPGFDKDILAWSGKRTVPSMRTYFKNMNAYHISYAAFGTKNTVPGKDYIRARRYVCKGLGGTELKSEYENTGLFAPGVPHQITIIKRDRDVFMHIKNAKKELLCHFKNSKFDPITEGRIGLRHMYTRGARYKDFKVSRLVASEKKADMPGVPAKEYQVKSLADLKSRLKNAKPGDTLVLPAETLKDWAVSISASGTETSPIVIRGEGGDKTVFTGKSGIRINGSSYVHLKDIAFSGTKGTAIAFNRTRHCSVSNTRFTSIKADSIVAFTGAGKANRIEACHFSKNPSKNIKISISKTGPVDTIIRNNRFEDVPPIGGNGRETIQIGQSQTLYGTFKANTLVENNVFLRCDGEAEIISNKSSANTYRGNLFKDCKGELVMRGGYGCTIENNRFENCKGGIRLSGKNHVVRNNVIWNSQRSGIRLMYGVSDKSPAFYLAVSGCVIENNTIVNAKDAGIFIGANRGNDLLSRPKQKKKLLGNTKRYGKHFKTIVAPHQNTIRANVICSQGKELLVNNQAPDNVIDHNLVYSTDKDAVKPEGTNQFLSLTFTDLDKGHLALKSKDKKIGLAGAQGAVCKPFKSDVLEPVKPLK